MKKTLVILSAFVALTLTSFANPTKILTVNLTEVGNVYWKAQQDRDKLNSALRTAQEEHQELGKELETLKNQGNKLVQDYNSPAISAERKAAIEKELRELDQAIRQKDEQIQNTVNTSNEKLNQEHRKVVVANLQAIRNVVVTIAEEEKADLVLSTDQVTVFYANPALDITKRVIDTLNAGRPATAN